MFRGAHCSTSGALNYSSKIQFRAPDYEWCTARNMLTL